MQVNVDRTIRITNCTCKAGKCFCKHAAAVCIYVNAENTCSKIDLPMIWNKPPEAQLKKYFKGASIDQIFGKKDEDLHNFAVCPESCSDFFDRNISVTNEKWTLICLSSIRQSESAAWYKERFPRITASRKGHRVKTRTEHFESLAKQFKNESYKGTLTESMRYGLKMEVHAKKALSELLQTDIHNVGLVVNAKQPFLACSPDGIIFNDNNLILLVEIKCLSSRENSIIFDRKNGQSFVEYLIVNDTKSPELKKSHIYYTQIQLSLYITRTKICHFFVFSEKDFVLSSISLDEYFLAETIPKIENFYYRTFLPFLTDSV